MVNFIVVTHGEFGAYLVEAAESIAGDQGDGVRSISISPRHTLEEIRGRVSRAIDESRSPEGVIILSDMPGGTPTNVSLPLIKDMPGVEMVSGLNLYMLVVGFTQRRTMSARELARQMVEGGQRSVKDLKALLAAGRR